MGDSRLSSKSIILRGIPASPGIGIGRAFVFKEEALSYVFKKLTKEETRKEIQRFRQAVTKTRTDILQSRDKVLKVLGKSANGSANGKSCGSGHPAPHQTQAVAGD